MIIVYSIAGIMGLGGISLTAHNVITIFSWLFAQRIEATVIDVDSPSCDHGWMRFCYEYQWAGRVCQTWGPWYESFNPLLVVFPKARLGRQTIIRIDTNKNKIIQSPLVSLPFAAAGAIITLCSAFIFILV